MEDWLRDLTPPEFVVYACIMRKTWGFGKFEDAIAISQIVEMSGIPRRSVDRALEKLKKLGLLNVRGSVKRPRIYEALMPRKVKSGNATHGATGTLGDATSGATVTPPMAHTRDKRQAKLEIVK